MKTLTEKFKEVIDDVTIESVFRGDHYDSKIIGGHEAAEQCTIIAEQERDEFAIQFNEWFLSNGISIMMNGKEISSQQLIEQFKQQRHGK